MSGQGWRAARPSGTLPAPCAGAALLTRFLPFTASGQEMVHTVPHAGTGPGIVRRTAGSFIVCAEALKHRYYRTAG